MSNYLQQFQAKTRRKADPALIERWEWDARFHGEQNIKPQVATARRTATTLDKACEQFRHLAPEQELALKAAARTMRKLAGDLALLATWAKDYRAFCEAAMKKEHTDAMEALAAQRWGDDTAAMEFENTLVQELTSRQGREALGRWMHSQGHCAHIPADSFWSPFSHGLRAGTASVRHRLAELVLEAKDHPNRYFGRAGADVHCSWSDYEAYLAYRKEVAKTTARLLDTSFAAKLDPKEPL